MRLLVFNWRKEIIYISGGTFRWSIKRECSHWHSYWHKSNNLGSIDADFMVSCRCCVPGGPFATRQWRFCAHVQVTQTRVQTGKRIFCSLITGNLLSTLEAHRWTSWVNQKWAGFMMCLPAFLHWYKYRSERAHTLSNSLTWLTYSWDLLRLHTVAILFHVPLSPIHPLLSLAPWCLLEM